MDQNSCNELAEIIRQIDGAERVQLQNLQTDYQDLVLYVDELNEADTETFGQIINRLLQDPARGYTRFVDRKPYISLALSFAYCKKGESVLALKYAQDAKWQFGRSKSEWNKAVSHWFLGIVYRNSGKAGKDRAELESAFKIFSGLLSSLTNSTKIRVDYELLERCRAQIKKINQALTELQEYGESQLTQNRFISHQVFSAIMDALTPPPDKLHIEWKKAVVNLDPADTGHIWQQIGILNKLLQAPEGAEHVSRPFVQIFLAHCHHLVSYTRQQQDKTIEFFLQDALASLMAEQDTYNLALVYWYLALMELRRLKHTKALSYLYEADTLLRTLLSEQPHGAFYEKVQSTLSKLESLISPLVQQTQLMKKDEEANKAKPPSEKKSLFNLSAMGRATDETQPETTPYRKNEASFLQVDLKLPGSAQKPIDAHEKTNEQDSHRPVKLERSIQHIIVPVDVQALTALNADSVPLQADLYTSLREFGENRGSKSAISVSPPDSRKATPSRKTRKIPSFPIYGQAAAGINGEPNWESQDIEKANTVYDDMCIAFTDQPYKVKFTGGTEYNFLSWRHYGWLQVVGESMNASLPIPIRNGNFVLFVENRNIDTCLSKIVVATLPEHESEPAQLVVKRLLKLSTQLATREDGYAPEYATFVLHSESSYEIDPKTGKSFDDIVIRRDGQIIGEVIAVAAPSIE